MDGFFFVTYRLFLVTYDIKKKKFVKKKEKPALSVLTDCIDFHTFAVGHSSVGESSPAEEG